MVNNIIANNRYGTVDGIGGWRRLRSYPNDRYEAAHAVFYGTEIRWNLTEEFKPFDIGIAKDIRTGLQLAFFWETASVADEKDKLGDIWKDSYGLGARMVTASGLVIRAFETTLEHVIALAVFILCVTIVLIHRRFSNQQPRASLPGIEISTQPDQLQSIL